MLAAALGTPPGPVHLNLPFAEPLVPDAGTPPAGRPGGGPWTAVSRARIHADPLPLDPAAPTLVIAGAGAPTEVRGWGLPVIAEPASGVWDVGLRAGPWLLGALPDALLPTQVLVAGRPTLHRPVQRLLADRRVAVYALADPQGRSWTDVPGTVRAVGSAPSWNPPRGWTARWLDADRAAAKALDAALDAPGAPGGLRLARVLVDALPGDALLVVGSSNPVRDLSLAAVPRGDITVLANRGVAGIDGTVSTAVGAALAHPGPAYALLGDLTLAARHDGIRDRSGRTASRPHRGGPQRQRRRDLRPARTGRPGARGGIRAGVRHAAHRRPGRTRGGDGPRTPAPRRPVGPTGALEPARGIRLVEIRADRAALRAGHAAVRAAVAAAL